MDIVERLRICAKYDPDQAEAADEIERLRGALKTCADNVKEVYAGINQNWAETVNPLKADNERLRQQNAELVEVLKEIANADMFDDECKPTGGGYLINKARAAIAKATGGE